MSERESLLPDAPLTPWGESWIDLANAAISDPDAPPFLALAAVQARLGDDRELRRLVADAVALNETEAGRA